MEKTQQSMTERMCLSFMKRCLLGLALVFCCLCGLWAGGKKEIRPVKVGMATDGGIIGDRSFNQGLWEGVLKAQQEYGFEAMCICLT